MLMLTFPDLQVLADADAEAAAVFAFGQSEGDEVRSYQRILRGITCREKTVALNSFGNRTDGLVR